MPVPKKRVGHSCQGHRRSNWKATVPTINFCSNCGAPKHTHTLCGTCGFYKDRIVIERATVEEAHSHDHDHGHDHDHDHGHSHDVASEDNESSKDADSKDAE